MKGKKKGTLYMLSYHLGEDKDTPPRTLELLKEGKLLVFEEAKVARKALKQAGITKQFLLYNEHKQQDSLVRVKETLKAGESVCYMSDQGSPNLCDPGQNLTKCAFELEAPVRVIPGPSSLIAAMSACPFPINGFIFTGLLPRKKEERLRNLKRYAQLKQPIITLDAPYRREALLEACEDLFGKRKSVFLALDISGEFETYFCGMVSKIREKTKEIGKLNFILIISS